MFCPFLLCVCSVASPGGATYRPNTGAMFMMASRDHITDKMLRLRFFLTGGSETLSLKPWFRV